MGNKSSSPRGGENERFHVDLVDPALPFTQAVDAVVCFIDENWSDGDELNKTLSELGGNRYESHRSHLRDKNRSCKIGEVHIGRGEKLPCQVVLFCAVPFQGQDGHLGEDYPKEVSMAVDNIFQVAFSCTQEIEIRSIAFPMQTGPPTPDLSVLLPLLFYKLSQLPADSILQHIHVFTMDEDICELISKTVQDFKVELEQEKDLILKEGNCHENDEEIAAQAHGTQKPISVTDVEAISTGKSSSPNECGHFCQHGSNAEETIADTKPDAADLENYHVKVDSMSHHHGNVNSDFDSPTFESQGQEFDDDLGAENGSSIGDCLSVMTAELRLSPESDTSFKHTQEDITEECGELFQNDLGLKPNTQEMPEDNVEIENQKYNTIVVTPMDNSDGPFVVETDQGSYKNDITETEHRNYHTETSYDLEEDDEIPWKKIVEKCSGDKLWNTFSEGVPSVIPEQPSAVKAKKKSSNKVVTFSPINELKEIDKPHSIQLVRSSSNSSAEDEPLDFENIIIQKGQRPSIGRKPMRGPPTIEVKYDPEVIEQKESKTYFCVICQTEKGTENQKKLDKCEHIFCQDCIDAHFKEKPMCPICKQCYGVVTGNMPYGLMSYRIVEQSLPGHDGYGTILLEYDIPDGVQTKEHPNPGQPFKGLQRFALLPNNPQGEKALKLLQKAFDLRLTFTVGTSRTTGQENVVTWNDIHHKTNIQGGPQRFGYPDPGYLDRLEVELASLGITDDDPTENEDDLHN